MSKMGVITWAFIQVPHFPISFIQNYTHLSLAPEFGDQRRKENEFHSYKNR